jgi:hypothetical protein
MVLYDPAAAAASQQRASKRARQDEEAAAKSSSSSAVAAAVSGAMVPHAGTILDVAPINTLPPLLRLPVPAAGREEPPCLRRHFLVALGLRADLPVHFIDDKYVTSTDLDPHQNRFRIPSNGVERRLRPLLKPQELDAASLLHDPCPVPRAKRPRLELQPGPPPEPQNNGAAEGQGEQLPPPPGKKMKKPKKKGKVHGGLRVKLVNLDAGAKELQMSRWESSRGTIVKGEGYLDFIRRCGFRERDAVEIWAFVQRRFHLFGADMCDDSLLHLLVVKKQEVPRCWCCPAPVPVHVPPPALPVP